MMNADGFAGFSRRQQRMGTRGISPVPGACRCEPVQGANNGGDKRVSTAVAGIVEDVKLTGAPALRQLPRGIQRAADVVAAVDQETGNAVQCRCITQQLVLPEEGGVPPVVGDQAREAEAGAAIYRARLWRTGATRGGRCGRRRG